MESVREEIKELQERYSILSSQLSNYNGKSMKANTKAGMLRTISEK